MDDALMIHEWAARAAAGSLQKLFIYSISGQSFSAADDAIAVTHMRAAFRVGRLMYRWMDVWFTPNTVVHRNSVPKNRFQKLCLQRDMLCR